MSVSHKNNPRTILESKMFEECLTTKDIASAVGVSLSTVRRWLGGTWPRYENELQCLADYVGWQGSPRLLFSKPESPLLNDDSIDHRLGANVETGATVKQLLEAVQALTEAINNAMLDIHNSNGKGGVS